MDVSILILAHKDSEYLDKAIQTSLSQKFNGSFEVILCSDGDTTLKKYSDKYKIKFTLSEKKNNLTTCSYSVNKGVEVSNGRFIKILAYDDWLPENSIQILFDKITESKSSMVCGNSNEMRGDKVTVVKSANIIYTLDELLVKNVIHGGTVLFNKQDFLEIGGYDNNLKFAEEYDFHLNLLFHNKKISYIDQMVHFYRRHQEQKGSTSLSPEQKKDKQKYVNTTINSKYYGNDIICGVATIKERSTNLGLTVKSIINQVDKLIVYQNGYKEIYDFLMDDKIEVISSLDTKIDMGDAGKFFKINDYKNSYYLSIDDDLIYPNDYVSNMVNNLKKFNNQVIVSHHGRRMKGSPKSYYLDILEPYRCLDDVGKITEVHFGGTGVMCLHTGFINNLSFGNFKSPNMGDIWVGKFAEDNGIPIMVLPHKKGWITTSLDLKNKETIHNRYKLNHDVQNKVIQGMNFKLKTIPKFKVVFLTCSYKRPEITKIFLNTLEQTQKKLTNYFDFTNIVVDSDETNLSVFRNSNIFNYYNYTNKPVSNKWNYGLSLCKNLDFDYVFIIGSDDVIDEKLMFKYYELMESGYDYFGITDLYFLDSKTDKLFYWKGYESNSGRMGETIGLGRCISKSTISKLNFKLWGDGINAGLDKSMESKIKNLPNLKRTSISLGKNYFACDIKSDFNIGSLNSYKNLIPVDKPPFILDLNTNNKPKNKGSIKSLSIIIPTFSNTIFIDECLSSIIKSVGSLDCEILVGIDNCEKTLSLIKHRVFDSRIRFFYFHHNVGPYIVKNSLVMESNSETILFFDSDDVMGETMVNEILKLQSFSDFVRPKYLNFNKTVPTTNTPIGKEKLFGEGVFSIKKSIFLSMNGFEGWRTSADTEFMGRLYKNSRKSINTPTVLFYRRIHENSLTQSKQTGYGSRVRSNYNSLIGNKTTFGPLSHFSTSPFYEVSVEKLKTPEVFDEIKHKRQIVSNVLDNILNKTVPPKSSIDYNSINNVIKNKGVYNPTESIKPIRENKPIDRTKINDLRKDSLLNQAREFGDIKRKKTSFLSNIFGGNNKRKGGPTF